MCLSDLHTGEAFGLHAAFWRRALSTFAESAKNETIIAKLDAASGTGCEALWRSKLRARRFCDHAFAGPATFVLLLDFYAGEALGVVPQDVLQLVLGETGGGERMELLGGVPHGEVAAEHDAVGAPHARELHRAALS